VQTPQGDWWAVFLGCRPYEGDYYNTGRETFLAPVWWTDGWPQINPGQMLVRYRYPYPLQPMEKMGFDVMGGNFVRKDDFQSDKLDLVWEYLRTPLEHWYSLTNRKGWLALQLRPETCSGSGNPSFLARRQQHAIGSASVAIDFSPNTENEKAGLVVFQNERRFYYVCKSVEAGEPVVQLFDSPGGKTPGDTMRLIASRPLLPGDARKKLSLKIEAHGAAYSFHYAVGTAKWNLLKDSVDARYLSTKDAGGFVGCVYALYATSLGRPSSNFAYYDWFEYSGNDSVFR
jgi:alpha-N-arabinofuranosidase